MGNGDFGMKEVVQNSLWFWSADGNSHI